MHFVLVPGEVKAEMECRIWSDYKGISPYILHGLVLLHPGVCSMALHPDNQDLSLGVSNYTDDGPKPVGLHRWRLIRVAEDSFWRYDLTSCRRSTRDFYSCLDHFVL